MLYFNNRNKIVQIYVSLILFIKLFLKFPWPDFEFATVGCYGDTLPILVSL